MNHATRKSATVQESVWCIAALAIWLTVTALFIGFRPEHTVMAVVILGMFFASPATRKLTVALVPFFLFGISYDWMNLCPNYMVNPIDTEGLYNAEKNLFGINTAEWGLLTPNEFLAHHTCRIADFMAGVFYLCWVPVPILFGLWMYFTHRRMEYLHFAVVFLLVNFIGFTIYYIHPAAPPWYIAGHGFEAVTGTTGEVAGLGAFGDITGWHVFDGLYARNSNIFAALPSLHSAYTLVALVYAIRYRTGAAWITALSVITLGIWLTAVYTSHHYIIDVIGGILCALGGFALFEYVIMRIPAFNRFMNRYTKYIS
ncbi:MAG: phosphatase PAP2 family protein [Muribaculaceae bacterium]|nr:phosphatase PAP2 family protein [Muribaculaceae bacterium]